MSKKLSGRQILLSMIEKEGFSITENTHYALIEKPVILTGIKSTYTLEDLENSNIYLTDESRQVIDYDNAETIFTLSKYGEEVLSACSPEELYDYFERYFDEKNKLA